MTMTARSVRRLLRGGADLPAPDRPDTLREEVGTPVDGDPGIPGSFLFGLGVLVTVLAYALFAPTLGASFAYDDVDFYNLAADQLSGRVPFWSSLFRPHNEHFLPAFRLVMLANAWLFGTSILSVRLLSFGAHVASALFLGVVAYRYVPSRAAATATALTYALAMGLSSFLVWFPICGTFVVGLAGITGAMLAVASQRRIGRRKALLLAFACCVLALVFENGLAPLVAGPALLDEIERRRNPGPRWLPGPLTLSLLVLSIATVAVSAVAYRRATGASIEVEPVAAAIKAMFLAAVAPFRLVFPAQHLPRLLGQMEGSGRLTAAYGLIVLLGTAALVAAILVPRCRILLAAALASAPGSLGFVTLAAVGRWRLTSAQIYDADRYFHPLLIPVSLLAGAAVASLVDRAASWDTARRRIVTGLLLTLGGLELVLHGVALRRRIPLAVYAVHERRYQQLALLADLLVKAAKGLPPDGPPLEFPDGNFRFKDVHNGRLSARFLLHVANRHPTDRLRLGSQRVSPRDESILNPVLERWAVEIGEPRPFYGVTRGELSYLRDRSAVNFTVGPEDDACVEGLFGWEGTHRWMGKRAVLRLRAAGELVELRLAAPVSALRRGHPGWQALRIAVSVLDVTSDRKEQIGVVEVDFDRTDVFQLPLDPSFGSEIQAHLVHLILEADRTWRPVDIMPGNSDDRELSVMIFEAGFRSSP